MKEADNAYAIQGFFYHSGGLARAGPDAAGRSGFGPDSRPAWRSGERIGRSNHGFVRAVTGRPGEQACSARGPALAVIYSRSRDRAGGDVDSGGNRGRVARSS